MKDLIGKIGRFGENHVEKIVLGIVGAVCVWLFFTRVIFSPNSLPVDRTGKALAPSQIDRYIYDQKAQELGVKLRDRKKSGAAKTYARRFDGPMDAKDPVIQGLQVLANRPLPKGFAGLFASPLSFITTGTTWRPGSVSPERRYADRKYRLPLIPDVTDVAANPIRAAAYVPLQDLSPQMTYDKAAVEPNDVDFVTVEARFDVAELYRRFQASFAGVDVQKEEWRDPCLAKPIFAAVQLERQELGEDGAWNAWQPVPRSRVEAYRAQLQVYEKMDDLPAGGLDLRLMQFKNEDLAMGLLQPEAYQIASAEEEWFPPTYYTKFKDLQRKVDADKRRDEKEKDRKQNDRGVNDPRQGANARGGQQGAYGGMGSTRGAPGQARGRGGMTGGDMYGGGRGGRGTRGAGGYGPGGDPMMGGRQGRGGRQGPGDQLYGGAYGMPGDPTMRRRSSTNEVYWDFNKEVITYREDLSKRDKPLLLWVFDDTVAPGKTYQYRLRVGVFNPVAGTGQFVERDLDKKDQVILWSPYSQVTPPIGIPQRIYLFAKDAQEKASTATVEVARYSLGYWHSQDFQVKLGETIGKVMEVKKEDDREKSRKAKMAGYPPGGPDRITGPRGAAPMGPGMMPGGMMPGPLGPNQQNVPQEVDYRTGRVLVDLVTVNDWGNAPNLRPRMYNDMLYTSDGTHIEHMPVSAVNWSKDLASAYQYIQTEKRKDQQPFRAFNKSGLRGRGRMGPGMEGGAYDESGMYEDMGGAYDEGMGMGPY